MDFYSIKNTISKIALILTLSIVVCISWNNIVCAKEAELDKADYIDRIKEFEAMGNMFRSYDDMVWDNGSRITPSERNQIREILNQKYEEAGAYTSADKADVICNVISELLDYDEEYDSKVDIWKKVWASPNLLIKGVGDEKVWANSDMVCHLMQCYLVTSGIDAVKLTDKREKSEYNIVAYYDEMDETWLYADPAACLLAGETSLPMIDFNSIYSSYSCHFQPQCVSFGYADKVCNTRSIYIDKESYLECKENHDIYDYVLIYDSELQKVIMGDNGSGAPLANHTYYGSVEKTGDNGEVITGWLSCTSFYSGSQNLYHKAYYQYGTPVQGYVTIDGKDYNFTYGGSAKYHRACYLAEYFLIWEILEPVDKPKEEADAYAKWRSDKLINLERVAEGMRKAGYTYQLDYTDKELEFLQNAANEATEFSYLKEKVEFYQPLISMNSLDIGIPETEDDVTEVQKAIAIIVYIREHLKYLGGYVIYDGYTALTSGYGTCAQYSELFSVMCELSGIRSIKIIGTLANRHAVYGDNWSDHVFNAAYLDGTWYYTDPTNIINLFTMDKFRGLIPLGLVNESYNASYHMVYLSLDDMMREEAHYRLGKNWVYGFDDSGNLGVYLYNSNGKLLSNMTDSYFHTDADGKRENLTGFVNYEKTFYNNDGEIEKWEVKAYFQCGLPVYGNRTIDGIQYEFGRWRDIANNIPCVKDHRISVSPNWKLNLKNGIGPFEYTGEEICPKPNITYTVDGVEKDLVEGVDYELSYANNVNVNVNSNIKASIIITGLGEYNYGAVINFTIKPYEIKEEDVVWPEQRDFIWSIDYEKEGGIPSVEPSFNNPLLNGNAYIEYGPVTFMNDMEHIYSINGTVTVKGTGNCTGKVSRDFSTSRLPITDENSFRVSLAEEEFVYNNRNKEPEVIIEWLDAEGNVYRRLDGGNESEAAFNKDKEFVVTYANNKNAGEATITVKGLRNFEGSLDKTFVINRADIAANENIVDIFRNAKPNESMYTGLPLEPIFDGIQQSNQMTQRQIYLSQNNDYIIEYSNNVHAGEAKAVMKGIGNYTGEIERTFTISPRLINKDNISLSKSSVTYNGEEQMPSVVVKGLKEGEDYTVLCRQYDSDTDSYVEVVPVNAGRYAIDILINNTDYELTGDCSMEYVITASGISGNQTETVCTKHELSYVAGSLPDCFNSGVKAHYVCNVCGKQYYDSDAQDEVVNNSDLIIPVDTVNGHDWGEWTIVRTADAENEGMKLRVCKKLKSHVEYEVIPKSNSSSNSGGKSDDNNSKGDSGLKNNNDEESNEEDISSTSDNNSQLTSFSKSRIKLTSLKNSKKRSFNVKWKKSSGAYGYEVQYALNKKFTKSKKTKYTGNTSLIVKGLKKGKKYYVRVRAYCIDDNDNKINGIWSSVKKVKIKK